MDTVRERISELRAADARDRATQAVFDDLLGRPGATAHRGEQDKMLDRQFRESARANNRAPIEAKIPTHEMRSGFQPGLERRDLLTTSGGGLTPTSFWSQLQRHMVDSSAILSAGATVIQTTSGETLKVPKSTAFSSAAIISEGGTITESDPTLATVSLGAYKYGFSVQISHELVEDTSFDVLGYLAEQSGIALGNAFGAHAITGTGTGQPSGVVTGATVGVTGPTGTSTSFGTHTTAGQGADLLLDLYGSLAEPYARSASAAWLMRNATFTTIRKLRDSTGRYIVTSDVPAGSGAAGMLLGRPVYLDPNVAAMAANAKSVIFGDMSRYWVRQVNGIRFERRRLRVPERPDHLPVPGAPGRRPGRHVRRGQGVRPQRHLRRSGAPVLAWRRVSRYRWSCVGVAIDQDQQPDGGVPARRRPGRFTALPSGTTSTGTRPSRRSHLRRPSLRETDAPHGIVLLGDMRGKKDDPGSSVGLAVLGPADNIDVEAVRPESSCCDEHGTTSKVCHLEDTSRTCGQDVRHATGEKRCSGDGSRARINRSRRRRSARCNTSTSDGTRARPRDRHTLATAGRSSPTLSLKNFGRRSGGLASQQTPMMTPNSEARCC